MATKVLMPKLGATMEEGIIESWLVDVGEKVEEGDPLVEIQTDKITIEVEAEQDGVLLKTLYPEGSTVKVQEVIAYLGEEGEEIEELFESKTTTTELKPVSKPEQPEVVPIEINEIVEDKIRKTPAARMLAKEHDINLSKIKGTGPNGRIQKRDVEKYLQNRIRITPLAKKIAEEHEIDYTNMTGSGVHGKIVKDDLSSLIAHTTSNDASVKKVPFKGIRKVIAERISESAYTSPHVTLMSEIDMTGVVTLREKLLPVVEELVGLRISYNEIILKATAVALKQNPDMNVSLIEDEIIYHSDVNIGMAVDTPNGLIVPVLKHVDDKRLSEITKEAKRLGNQAREGKLSVDETKGSTFTVSNLGMYAVDGFTPIINIPNAAILGVGRIQKKPVIKDDEVVIRSMMSVSLSFDHRIIDGAPAAVFLTDLKNILEQPLKLLI